MKKKTTGKRILPLLMLFLLLLCFGVRFCLGMHRISASAREDLLEELTSLHGESYSGKIISSQTAGEDLLYLREDMRFSIKKEKIRPWNDTMPAADAQGIPLSKTFWISVYQCQVDYIRYVTVDGETVPDTEIHKYITYTAYEDNDLNSSARAVLDASSGKTTYSGTETDYKDIEQQLADVSADMQEERRK